MEKQSLEELREILKFGKFGFKGTLWTGFCGMLLILALAILDGFTEFSISGWELVLLALIILAGSISFGYLSLRKLPQISINLKDGDLTVATELDNSQDAEPNKKLQPTAESGG